MNDEPEIIKVDGRTKEGRAARAAAAGQPSAEPAQRTRAPVREPSRGGVVGRDGEILSRKRTAGIDPFDIPPEIVPQGWCYQWNVVSVVGNADVVMDQGMSMYENGWRPVPAERHPGRFVPSGTKGQILRGGQRLEERPLVLTEEAREEEIRTAKRLISDRNDSLKLSGVKNSMPDGFEMAQRKYRGTGGDIRMSIDRGLDIPQPEHKLAEPGD
jgi:hypothetical protein